MKNHHNFMHQRGTTLIELMISIAITMFIVAAAAYVYLGTRESQSAIERMSASNETGAFALQQVGRDIMNAGFYPATMPPTAGQFATMRRADSYPPATGIPVRTTDWIAPHSIYLAPIFGCEGARFSHVTATCGATVAGAPDSIVLNYFTNESVNFGATVGQRRDCTGADVAPETIADGDPSNAVRKLNTSGGGLPPWTSVDPDLPPQSPLFVSNFYNLNATVMVIDGQTINTQSLACGGNGSSRFGITNPAAYQPLLAGIDDLQFTYGVFGSDNTRAPDRFYTATEVSALPTINVHGTDMSPWNRVVAVRVCIMSRTLGGNTKIADKAGELRTYLNCADQSVTQAASDTAIHKRHVQVFAVRNRLNQGF